MRLRPGSVEWREIDGEVVALDLRRSVYLAVNRSGTLLWPEVVAGATRDELVRRVREEFGLDGATAESDVEAFLRQLEELDLLERAEG